MVFSIEFKIGPESLLVCMSLIASCVTVVEALVHVHVSWKLSIYKTWVCLHWLEPCDLLPLYYIASTFLVQVTMILQCAGSIERMYCQKLSVIPKAACNHDHQAYLCVCVCVCICWQLPSNQSLYRKFASYRKGVGHHKVGQ